MSWKGGSELMGLIINNVVDRMDPEDREILYKELIEYFEDSDCDTLYECLEQDVIFDKVFKDSSVFAEEQEDSDDWDDQDNTTF